MMCRLLNCIYFVVLIYLFIYWAYAVAVATNKDVYWRYRSPGFPDATSGLQTGVRQVKSC